MCPSQRCLMGLSDSCAHGKPLISLEVSIFIHLVKVNEGSRELGSTRFSTENYWLRRAVGVQLITDNSFGECLMLPRDVKSTPRS